MDSLHNQANPAEVRLESSAALQGDSERFRPYGRIAIGLHWLLAAAIFYQLVLGFWMIELPKSPVGLRAGWFNWHKSIGLLIGLLMCLRLIWRLTHKPQKDNIPMPMWQRMASQANHLCLYLSLLVMPLSGFLGSNFTPYPVKFFGWELPRFLDPSPELKLMCSNVHFYTCCALIFLIGLHLLGAAKHALQKDGVLSRMSFRP